MAELMERTKRRVGLLVASSDMVQENDLWRRLPPNVTLHVSRMFLESTTVVAEEKMLDEELSPAAKRLSSVRPDLMIFGCTSAAALRGLDGDAKISNLVSKIAGCPCCTVMQAVIDELRRINPQSLLVITPYLPELSDRVSATLEAAGLRVSGVVGYGLWDDHDITGVNPAELMSFVIREGKSVSRPPPDCVFISCTGFRSFEVADELQTELGVPVITSNQATYKAIATFAGLEQTA